MDVLRRGREVQLQQLGGLLHDVGGDDLKGVAVHHQTHGLGLGHIEHSAQRHAGVGAAAALGAADVVKVHPRVGDLLHAVDITQRTDGVGAAAGDLVVGLAQRLAHAVHFLIDIVIAVGVHEADIGIHEILQKLIALAVGDALLLQDEDGGHAQLLGAGRCQHGVVGLCAAGGEHHLRALALGVRQQELQLTHLVAAQTDTGQVVALDIYIGVQQTADVLQLLNGGGEYRQRDAGEILQILHVCSPFAM